MKQIVWGFFFIIFSIFYGCGESNQESEDTENTTQIDTVIPPKLIYGFPEDSFNIRKGKIQKNQFFSDLLLPNGIDYPTIDLAVNKGRETFDVRKMRAGRSYTLLLSKDSTEKLQKFIYEINPIEYVVFDFENEIEITRHKKPVTIKKQTASGIINSSLYMTMVNKNLNPVLANELAEIYAWTIDFYRIQKGDKFKVIYEEKFVEDKSVGIHHINAALFEHFGEEHYAIHFEQGGFEGYYDEDNRGLKRPFLKAPVKYSRISSRYSPKRFHPVQKRFKAHLGTDYAAPTGTPIMSTANGTVIAAGYGKYNGNYVKVKHNGTYTTQYLHMSKIKRGIRNGVKVKQGDIIGYVGSTGLATGPHVCYRFWKNGKQVDPYQQKLPKSAPIQKANLPIFKEIKKQVKKELKSIDY